MPYLRMRGSCQKSFVKLCCSQTSIRDLASYATRIHASMKARPPGDDWTQKNPLRA